MKLTSEQLQYKKLVETTGAEIVQAWGYGHAEYVIRLADNCPFVSVFHPNNSFAFAVCVEADNERGIITDLVRALNDRDYRNYKNPEIIKEDE